LEYAAEIRYLHRLAGIPELRANRSGGHGELLRGGIQNFERDAVARAGGRIHQRRQ
jgi:hypothetical protein